MAGANYPDLRDKTVLITGGAGGIGAAFVRAFVQQGCKVGFIDIDLDGGTTLSSELLRTGARVLFKQADVRDIDALQGAIAAIAAELGPVNVLINNAASDERHDTANMTAAYFDERIAVNFRHQLFASQAVLPGMQALGGGSIICLGSISWMVGFGGMPVYQASKAAVLGLVNSLARDYGAQNIRVNALTPGWIMTERQIDRWLTPELDAWRAKQQALPRKIYPEDVAKVALFLASDESAAITGQNHIVDGGWS